MNINQTLAKKYDLNTDDFWKQKQSGKWIISHDAVMKIAMAEGIVFHEPTSFVQSHSSVAFLGSATLKDVTVWTTGEASPDNCFNKHIFAMAEKRLKDRLTLTLIGAYHEGLYSDSEADSFAKEYKTEEEQFLERQQVKRDQTATDKQKRYLSELLASSHLTDEYKVQCLDHVNNGITIEEASNMIDETQTLINKAKDEERTAQEA